MYQRSLYEIVMAAGRAVQTLVAPMQSDDELFASRLTLPSVEAQLLLMAGALGHVTPVLHRKLHRVDWNGWSVLHDKLRNGERPRREETWYAISALVPQTMQLLAELRRREPALFDWDA